VNAHRAIYDALAARDGETAGELISTHIQTAWTERKRIKRT
jgi:DNA-binding GntR family transcriptional regulator